MESMESLLPNLRLKQNHRGKSQLTGHAALGQCPIECLGDDIDGTEKVPAAEDRFRVEEIPHSVQGGFRGVELEIAAVVDLRFSTLRAHQLLGTSLLENCFLGEHLRGIQK